MVQAEVQSLELYGEMRPVLHRPRLAGVACWLFAVAYFLQVATAVVGLTSASRVGVGLSWKIEVVGTWLSAGAIVIAAIVLFVADLGHRQVSLWPLRVLFVLILVYAIFQSLAESFFFAGPEFFFAEGMLTRYTALLTTALAAASGAYAFGLIYVYQIATLVRDRFLRRLSLTIFSLALLVTVGQFIDTASALKSLCGYGAFVPIELDHFLRGYWSIVEMALAVAITTFFVIAGARLRRVAKGN